MSDDPINLVLENLRVIRSDIGELRADMKDIKSRMTALEIGLANLAATEASHYANIALRTDRQDDRLDRIERRLELVSA